jgi:hypothetical protein
VERGDLIHRRKKRFNFGVAGDTNIGDLPVLLERRDRIAVQDSLQLSAVSLVKAEDRLLPVLIRHFQ